MRAAASSAISRFSDARIILKNQEPGLSPGFCQIIPDKAKPRWEARSYSDTRNGLVNAIRAFDSDYPTEFPRISKTVNWPFPAVYHFGRFVFRHQLRQSAVAASLSAGRFTLWRLSQAAQFGVLVLLRLVPAARSDQFAFLHHWKSFQIHVSSIAWILRT
jgi:hypothetical protein